MSVFPNSISTQSKRRGFKAALLASVFAIASACSSPEERVEKFSASGMEFLEAGDFGRANVQFQNALKINEEHVPTLVGMARLAERRQDFNAMFGYLQRIERLDPDNVEALVNLGKLYLISSDETAAIEYSERALALAPESAEALALSAGIQMKLGDTASAEEIARRIIEKDPTQPEAVTILASMKAQQEDYDGAIAEIDKALEIDPKISILQLLRIELLRKLGREDEVNQAFERLVELFPEETAYRTVYANTLLRKEQYEPAVAQLEAVADLLPDEISAKTNVIRVISAWKGQDAARERMLAFVEAAPDDIELKLALVDFYRGVEDWDAAQNMIDELAGSKDKNIVARAKIKQAGIAMARDNRDAARAVVNDVLEYDSSNTDALVLRAGLRIQDEDYDDAIVDLRAALNNDPNLDEAMMLMGSAFERQGKMEFAQAEYTKAFETSGRDPQTALTFSRFLLRNGETRRAENVLVQSLAKHPGELDNLRQLANIRLAAQDWQGAEEVADIIENLNANNKLALEVKSAALAGLEDYDRIINTLESAKGEAPLEARPLATLTAAYLQQGRIDDAETLLNDVLASNPDDYSAKLLLSQTLLAKGDAAGAEDALVQATRSNPDRGEAFELLYRYYLQTNRLDDARQLIDDGIAAAPELTALQLFKADVLINSGELEEALNLYDSLLETRPNDLIVVNNFVSLSSELRTDAASVARALEVAEILKGSENAFFLDTLGWAQYRAGKYDEALDNLNAAVAASNGNSEILYHLGAAQIAAGETESGRANLTRALQNAPENATYVAAIRNLLGDG